MTELEESLRAGADVNMANKNGFTLLMSFIQNGDIESIKVLLRYGARLNLKDSRNFTAMDYAIKANNLEIVQLLVENGAIVSGDNYMLALHIKNKEIVEFFDHLDPDKHIFLKNKKKYT